MALGKHLVYRNPEQYCAWPGLAMLPDGRLLCVFTMTKHHLERAWSQIMLIESDDRGRTWGNLRAVTENTDGLPYYYNNARVNAIGGGKVIVMVDRILHTGGENAEAGTEFVSIVSDDNGKSWKAPLPTGVHGIVPGNFVKLAGGRLLMPFHCIAPDGNFHVKCVFSDDLGESWHSPVEVASVPGLKLCEPSVIDCGDGVLVALMRENSGVGMDCQKCISRDGGMTWGRVTPFPLPGCHRPIAGWLQDGRALITFRFAQGAGAGRWGRFQNFMLALTDRESLLQESREKCFTRIMPIDYDRAQQADTGYSGWGQYPDGEIAIVNYIVDDAIDRAQLRCYTMMPDDIAM